MKKRLLGLILALTCLLLPILTSCGDGEDYVATAKVQPMTITLYGIKGEGTTDEAILAVQNELNEYTEGNLSTRVLLRLFTEDEYYEKLDEAFVKAQKYKEEQKNNKKNDKTTEKVTVEETGEGSSNRFEVKFEDEKGTQVDIFMVRGAEKLSEYVDRKLATSVKIAEKSSLISKYISSRYLALASSGKPVGGGELEKTTVYGIPCNYVTGDYTYLLVNKEIADNYGYAEKNLDTLDKLSLYLKDAAADYSDYITLYNAPDINVTTVGNTMIGAVLPSDVNAFTMLKPANLFADSAYVNYYKNLNLFEAKGYITECNSHALPENEKVAAAFIKGNADLPAKYEDDYYVLTYEKPVVEDVGTVFCVSTYASNSARCLEVINALMTNTDYRNTFQYGVENQHYKVNDYTKEIEIISSDYNMNYADTGNMFILKPNVTMSDEMLALAKNNWELAKQQYRDAVVNPYTAPYLRFELTYYDETNYVSSGWYKAAYDSNIAAVVAELDDYKAGLKESLESAQKKIDEENEKNKDKEDYVEKVLDVDAVTADYTKDYVKKFEKTDEGKWYKSVLNGNVESDVEKQIKSDKKFTDALAAAKAEAEASNKTFDQNKFIADYIKPTVDSIKSKYTFAYAPGYTSENIEAIKALNEDFVAKLMAYAQDSELTFEEYAAELAAEYAENEAVKLMLDADYADSITAQYTAWAKKMGFIE